MAKGTSSSRASVCAKQRLAAAGRPDQEDVRLVDLDLRLPAAVHQPLVMVVDGDGQDLLGAVLADDVLIEVIDDLPRREDAG